MKHRTLISILFITVIILSYGVPLLPSHQSVIIQRDKQSVFHTLSERHISYQNNPDFYIVAPRSSAPVFVLPGEPFTVSVNMTRFDNAYVVLETAYEPVVDEYWLDIQQVTETGYDRWDITCIVPVNTYKELYNLSVTIEKEGIYYTLHQPRAVAVVESFSQNFSFIHLTDLHVGDPRGFFVNIRETLQHQSIKKCISEINALHPDFVVISGDLVYGQWYPFEYRREYQKCYELLQLFDVPTFLVPGNHDGYRRLSEDGLNIWEDYFGSPYYSFDYGDVHFLAINSFDMPAYLRLSVFFLTLNWGGSISNDQLSWIQNDVMNNNGKMMVMFMHHNPLWETTQDSLMRKPYENREEVLSLIDDYNVSLVLAGHVHWDNVTMQNDTLFVTTTTPESIIRAEDGYWGYRLITVLNGSVSSVNYKPPKYSIPSYHVNYSWKTPYEVGVENDLDCMISCLLRFIVPPGQYIVNHGSIDMVRGNEVMDEVYVRVSIAPNSYTSVFLTQE